MGRQRGAGRGRLQCGQRQRPALDRPEWRPAHARRRRGPLDRGDPLLGDAQLRAAGDREHRGLCRARSEPERHRECAHLLLSGAERALIAPMSERPNFITPAGYRALREEYDALFAGERPKLLETIAWAAANGDRSENADYQYGRRRLREIDRRINFLARRMKAAKVTDPAQQPDKSRCWFGARVT